ncbi:hypothetical protein KBB96_08620 [Luteolibacter ambystomatis]|uniref:Uncharacterized protein n=1 Tax=Luteolibacter ambystomatis TaxID=2824561 RepID=A0A975J2V1_9BACT|nr:hypothetical protein [Luteolibacter ambystomatis]QUE52941.1 hypothetical protein KBB96_08620 [Luteolibacter ambystomatis]
MASIPVQAAVIWTETTNGDLSNSQSAPNSFNLTLGTSSVIGSVTGGTDTQDWLNVTIPAGMQLSSLVLTSYSSTDAQGFMGVQSGSAFVGSPFTASNYLGYSHYGTAAVNGSLPATNTIGMNMLSIMSNPAAAPGSQGFTPPLGPGSYTFLFQQQGAATNYQFDFVVVPEPETIGFTIAIMGGSLLLRRRPARL